MDVSPKQVCPSRLADPSWRTMTQPRPDGLQHAEAGRAAHPDGCAAGRTAWSRSWPWTPARCGGPRRAWSSRSTHRIVVRATEETDPPSRARIYACRSSSVQTDRINSARWCAWVTDRRRRRGGDARPRPGRAGSAQHLVAFMPERLQLRRLDPDLERIVRTTSSLDPHRGVRVMAAHQAGSGRDHPRHPNVGEEALRNLDERDRAMARGAAGDILVGKVTPRRDR